MEIAVYVAAYILAGVATVGVVHRLDESALDGDTDIAIFCLWPLIAGGSAIYFVCRKVYRLTRGAAPTEEE